MGRISLNNPSSIFMRPCGPQAALIADPASPPPSLTHVSSASLTSHRDEGTGLVLTLTPLHSHLFSLVHSHSLTRPHAHSTYSLFHLNIRSLNHTQTQSHNDSIIYTCPYPYNVHKMTLSLIYSLIHSFTHLPTHTHTHSHSFTHSLTD